MRKRHTNHSNQIEPELATTHASSSKLISTIVLLMKIQEELDGAESN
jgi:hypothetical protein